MGAKMIGFGKLRTRKAMSTIERLAPALFPVGYSELPANVWRAAGLVYDAATLRILDIVLSQSLGMDTRVPNNIALLLRP